MGNRSTQAPSLSTWLLETLIFESDVLDKVAKKSLVTSVLAMFNVSKYFKSDCTRREDTQEIH